MRKGIFLVSAGLCVLSVPAWAQDQAPTVEEVQENTQAAEEQNPDALETGVDTDADSDADLVAEETTTGQTIVTATRRKEALSDVPLAVSAVTQQTLINSGIADIRQLNQVSPSLYVSSTSSEAGAGGARIRGIGTVGENPGLESSVATFIDGVYRNRASVGLSELGEVDRIEVLRGPQGTLFGRNASAGLISVITAKPKFDFTANGEMSGGNHGLIRFVGGVTGPVAEKIALRLDGVYYKRHGLLKDVVSGRRYNNRDRYLLRGQALFEPSERFNFRVVGDYTKRNERCCGATYLSARDVTKNSQTGALVSLPSTIAGVERGLGGVIQDDTFKHQIAISPGQNLRSDVRDWGVSGEGNLEIGKSVNLTSITAYRDWRFKRGQDVDYNSLDIGHRNGDGLAGQRFKTFTQELRFQGSLFEDKLDWLVGGYFAHEILNWRDNIEYGSDAQRYGDCLVSTSFAFGLNQPSLIQPGSPGCINRPLAQALAGNAAVPAATRGVLGLWSGTTIPGRYGYGALSAALGQPQLEINGSGLRDQYKQKSTNWAIFTHNKWNITDRLALTIGVRYTHERKRLAADLSDNNRFCNALRASAFASLSGYPCGLVPALLNGSVQGAFQQSGAKKTEHRWTGTANLSYKLAQGLMTYTSFSRGYKAGGFNLDRAGLTYGRPDLNQLKFAPEMVQAWEIGAKWGSRAVDINVAGFYQRFKDFQLNTFNGVNFVVENISKCTGKFDANGNCVGDRGAGVYSRGVEIEAFMRPTRHFSTNIGFTLADTKYRKNLVGANGRALAPALSQLPGHRMSNAPLYVLTGAISWRPPLNDSGLTGLVYVDGRYQSEFNTGSDLDIEKKQNGYGIVNARIGIRGDKERWGIELWAQNLFNTNYWQVAFDAPVQGGAVPASAFSAGANNVANGKIGRSTQLFAAFLGEQRTWGVTGRVKF